MEKMFLVDEREAKKKSFQSHISKNKFFSFEENINVFYPVSKSK